MNEIKTLSRNAASVWVGQLAAMGFGITDTVVAGRHSDGALAALSVGFAIFISVYVALVTLVQALLPVWAELHGARRQLELGRAVRQSVYLSAVVAVLGLTVLLCPGPLLTWTQVPTSVQSDVSGYLSILALAFVPALLFRLYGTLNQSLGRPLLVTWLQLGALGMKIPLSIVLGLGWTAGPDDWFALPFTLAIPAMGVDGCAWATVVVNVTMLLLALTLLRTQALYRPYDLWRRLENPDWALLRHCARLGVPTALTVLVEISSFTLMALFIARQGTVASAAHQVASNLVGVLYMLPLAVGIATSARVSFWLGAGDAQQARRCTYQGLFLASAASASFSAILFIIKTPLAAFYASNPAVAAVAASLLGWVAAYHVADAVQAVCGFILRSYRVAIAPMVIYATLLWGLGLGGALVWAYAEVPGLTLRPEPSTFWICGVLALALAAVSLLVLLLRATARATAQTPPQNTSPAPAGS